MGKAAERVAAILAAAATAVPVISGAVTLVVVLLSAAAACAASAWCGAGSGTWQGQHFVVPWGGNDAPNIEVVHDILWPGPPAWVGRDGKGA